jgi:hypothetical protein
VSGWLFARFGPSGFWVMAVLSILALPVVASLRRALQRDDQEPTPVAPAG